MTSSASAQFFDRFEAVEDLFESDLSIWGWSERVSAVQDILECNNQSSPVIDAIVEVARTSLGTEAAFMSFIAEGHVLRQKNASLECGGLCRGAPGFCFWTLVPENPQALVIEDALLDARISNSPLVKQSPFIRSYAAAPLVTSNSQRIGTLCVLGTKPRSFSLHHVTLMCNLAELIMRLLEGQVMLQRPSSPLLKGQHSRWPAAYQQAFALVDVTQNGWPILASTTAFDALAGREVRTQDADLFSLLRNPIEVKEKMVALLAASALTDGRWNIDGLSFLNKGLDKSLMFAAIMTSASRVLDPGQRPVGIPSLFSKDSALTGKAVSEQDSIYIMVLTSQYEHTPQKPAKALPIPHLQLQSPLGAGSYARVYRGVYGKTKVAVKIVHQMCQALQTDIEPSEVTYMQAVHHPNLLRLYEWKLVVNSKREPRLWLVAELCDGGCISDAIDQGYFKTSLAPGAELDTRAIAHVFKELASGLKALHDKGIIHCDISGGNILLQSSEDVIHGFTTKICDFGLARLESMTSGAIYTGSYAYQAPEVLKTKRASKASDIYSLGTILYEMLISERAWNGLHPSQIYYQVVECSQTPAWPDNVPKGLQSVAEKLLQYEAEDRCTLEAALHLIQDHL